MNQSLQPYGALGIPVGLEVVSMNIPAELLFEYYVAHSMQPSQYEALFASDSLTTTICSFSIIRSCV
jgi:hypothetical protein